jgi:hypothetical protein
VSAQDVERLRELYEEWGRGDFGRDDIFDPDVAVHDTHGWPESGETRGLGEFRKFVGGWLSAWERPLVVETDDFIDVGDRVLVLIRWRGRGKGSGAEIESEGAHLWTMSEGKAVRFDAYRDRAEALVAIGRT